MSKWGLILSICLWWVKLILSPVSYEPAFGLWKAVFIEIQKSNFITVRFLTFEIGLYLGPNHQKMMRIIPRNILRTLNQKFIQYSARYSTFCGFGLLSTLRIFLWKPPNLAMPGRLTSQGLRSEIRTDLHPQYKINKITGPTFHSSY